MVRITDDLRDETHNSSELLTHYFGNEVHHDVNGDGTEDIVFLVRQYFADGKILYYVVAGLKVGDGYQGSEGMLLGDRIAPQTTEMRENNIVVVNYAVRKPGEKMTAQPSVGKTTMLKLDPTTLQWGEVAQNFEGEADPRLMSLGMKTWVWQSASYNSGQHITPQKKDVFTITFGKDGRFSATTDCNALSGTYSSKKETLSFGAIASTKMFCANAEESIFTDILKVTQSYQFTSKGELILTLAQGSGAMIFK